MLGLHVHAVDVVQVAVPGLGHDGQRPDASSRLPSGGQRRAAYGMSGVPHDAHGVGVGDGDGPSTQARLLEPGQARHLAVAVQREGARRSTGCFAASPFPRGRIAVTPVRTASPSISVAWPTSTPGTSVIAFQRPGLAEVERNAEVSAPDDLGLGREGGGGRHPGEGEKGSERSPHGDLRRRDRANTNTQPASSPDRLMKRGLRGAGRPRSPAS